MFLGFSVIIFIITYGIMFYLVPMILGVFFSAMPIVSDPTWAATNTKTQGVLQFLSPLVPTIGIFILVIKVLMTASVRGRD